MSVRDRLCNLLSIPTVTVQLVQRENIGEQILKQGRIHDCLYCGQLDMGSYELGRAEMIWAGA